jgi:hypothetical protein
VKILVKPYRLERSTFGVGPPSLSILGEGSEILNEGTAQSSVSWDALLCNLLIIK